MPGQDSASDDANIDAGLDADAAACPPGICQPIVFAREPNCPAALAVDSTHLYWVNESGGTVEQAPLDGGAPVILASYLPSPYAIAVDGTTVYWVTRGRFGDAGYLENGSLMSVPIGGGAVATLAAVGYAGGLAVDSTSVYWGDRNSETVMKAALDGAAPVVLATHSGPYRLAVDSTSVYWSDQGVGAVRKAPLDGGTAMMIANEPASAIVASPPDLYWFAQVGALDPDSGTFPDGSVMTEPLAGGDAGPVAFAAADYVQDLAVDDASVYWTTREAVFKAASLVGLLQELVAAMTALNAAQAGSRDAMTALRGTYAEGGDVQIRADAKWPIWTRTTSTRCWAARGCPSRGSSGAPSEADGSCAGSSRPPLAPHHETWMIDVNPEGLVTPVLAPVSSSSTTASASSTHSLAVGSSEAPGSTDRCSDPSRRSTWMLILPPLPGAQRCMGSTAGANIALISSAERPWASVTISSPYFTGAVGGGAAISGVHENSTEAVTARTSVRAIPRKLSIPRTSVSSLRRPRPRQLGQELLGARRRATFADELLSQPGQFYVDTVGGTVSYIPRTGEDLATADVELPIG